MAKGGSKVLTAVISFLLGFIFAILVEVGAVFGVYYYVAHTDLDKIFNDLGIENKDEEGNYIYVNTDGENGGATNVGELLTLLKGYLYSEGSSSMDYPVLGKSLNDISNLLPVVQKTLSEKLYPVVNGYMDIDWEEFEKVSISELPQFLSDSIMDIRPAKLLSKMGMNGLVGPEANILVNALLAGAEFDYAYTESGLKFPVYYDTYVYNSELSRYYREEAVNNQMAYPVNLSEDLLYDTTTKNDDGERIYRLYYIPCVIDGVTLADAPLASEGDTVYAEGTTFIAVKYVADSDEYELNLSSPAEYYYNPDYGYHNIDRTGNFYYTNGNGDELQIYPVTIRSFSDPKEVFKPLYSTDIKELLGGGDNSVIQSMFGNLSVGELMDGKIDFDELVNNLELSSVINVDPEQSVMAFIGYGLSSVKKVEGEDWDYVGHVDVDGISTECRITAELKGEPAQRTITRVWYITKDEQGNEVEVEVSGTKVREVAGLATDMQITALLNVKADDAILSYLGYGLSGVSERAGEGYTHVGNYEVEKDGVTQTVTAYINSDEEGYITHVWYDNEGFEELIPGTSVSKISDRVSGIMDHLTLPDVLDIKANQSITAYVGYGITHIAEATGHEYSHTAEYKIDENATVECFIQTDEEGKITSVWYLDGAEKKYVGGTVISKLPDRIDGISNDLTLSDVMDVKESDSILWALKDAKISELGTEVKKLKIKDVLDAESIQKSAILKQLENKTIDELSTAIDAISIQSIYAKEIYQLEAGVEDPQPVTEYKQDMLYLTFKDDVYSYVNEDSGDDDLVGVLTAEEFAAGVASGVQYYSYGEAQGMWRLILFKNGREKVYTLNNFNNMVNTCTQNIYNATLTELQKSGIIESEKDLSKTLVWYSKEADGTYTRHDSEKLGDITLKRLIDIVLNMDFPSLPTT